MMLIFIKGVIRMSKIYVINIHLTEKNEDTGIVEDYHHKFIYCTLKDESVEHVREVLKHIADNEIAETREAEGKSLHWDFKYDKATGHYDLAVEWEYAIGFWLHMFPCELVEL